MPHDESDIGSPEEWLKRARSNLARARQAKSEEVLWEDYCFDCQQAVEKALKALLVSKNIGFRFVHDIAELLTNLETNKISLTDEIREAAILTDYAVEARYPGPSEPVTEEEFNKSLEIAEKVVKWAEDNLRVDKPARES